MDLRDNRRHARFLAWIEAVVTDPHRATHPATIVEISASGALLELGERYPHGTPLAVFLKRNGSLVRIACRVRHALEGPGLLAGVEFEEEQRPGTHEAIAAIISELEAASRPRYAVR